MGQIWDPAYLKRRLEHCRQLASTAIHPDVKNAHLGYVRHYEQLLETLNVRSCRP